jgi:hypothetical protein
MTTPFPSVRLGEQATQSSRFARKNWRIVRSYLEDLSLACSTSRLIFCGSQDSSTAKEVLGSSQEQGEIKSRVKKRSKAVNYHTKGWSWYIVNLS